ncbi:uncharacterized protein N7496_002075 [Penicillium cataractarum]|uniref:HAT C-terminal dimerisation domain-containing protein n=1 Tax=Penicillium cataractarum TaxID=2100454 RepID=A0A9W9VF24_9EURO|nr:uncharacterized protein N7496_002075 [Penicillium cataractarum]KAJ5379647.1 hypothetical protein N7496_002075 [Penicillium cataractarum]
MRIRTTARSYLALSHFMGSDLSVVLLDLLQKHRIEDLVLTVTTDNASNNFTFIESVQNSLQSFELPNQTPIIRMPCMAHVIQLSLNALLGKMEAVPKNDKEEVEWIEAENNARRENREIVRRLAVWINKSSQRREAFLNLQAKEPKLLPMQDVKTRWNSTFLMLRRAKRLRATFDEYCPEYDLQDLVLSPDEWRQIDYLLTITQPFFTFTTTLSKTKDVSVHIVFGIYNMLFDHLEKSIAQLARKKVKWKTTMMSALQQAKQKLSDYYAQTDEIHGDLYAIATIIAPQTKVHFFPGKNWTGTYRAQYRKSLEKYLEPYQQRYWESQPTANGQSSAEQISELDILITPDVSTENQTNGLSELDRYLGISTRMINPRVFWKNNQHEFPILASIARDVLSIPATGSGVERLFNSARDICHYRRGSLKPKKISDLMIFMCTTRFQIESEQLAFIEEYLTTQEIQAVSEEQDAQKPKGPKGPKECKDEFDLISDDEDALAATSETLPVPSRIALGKRPRKDDIENPEPLIELDDEDEIPLPDICDHYGESSAERRTSGRVPKRSKRDDNEWEYPKP